MRQKSRFDATDSAGRTLAVFLSRGTAVRGGDALVAEDGSLVVVKASPQPVLVVRHCPQHGSAFDLLRAAYHLGNRHVPLELRADHLKLEPDHVLADMLRAMHLIVSEETTAFEPETGAYAATAGAHAHGHSHDPDHAHGHGHGQSLTLGHTHPAATPAPRTAIPIKATPTPHEHGPGCGHDHGSHKH